MADDKLSDRLEELLQRSKHPMASRNALALLFPKLETILKTYLPHRQQDSAQRKRSYRISEPEFAATYFGLAPRQASWGKTALEKILNMAPDNAMSEVENHVIIFTEEDQYRLRREFVNALPGAFGPTRPLTGAWLRVLSDYLQRYLTTKLPPIGFYNVNAAERFRQAALESLKTCASDVRAVIFSEAVSTTTDLSLLCALFRTVAGDFNEEGATNRDANFFGNATAQIRAKLLDRVKSVATSGRMWSQASPGMILWFWWGCRDADELRKFTANEIMREDGLRALLDVPVSRVYSTSGDYDVVARDHWSRIVDLDALKQKAELLAKGAGGDKKLAIRFLQALERGDAEKI